ncbi:hypothetical protein PPERSA_01038 [Pseudocohnilembus persalinus]|uniref:CCAAT-binding factor domain-containing protein n=1 Tax=Pseudocohnilembus persalinus TaxID=266149 RepID=A0A0V0QVJ4_PSEPJ|nr:hypothetical protein PPERSA_01038 [Pseudocohnilembus persalinus]|eukprot:KRX05960.1 hypothetical protein PPERSA_01038 [Pseudocohnilembus persalinus]
MVEQKTNNKENNKKVLLKKKINKNNKNNDKSQEKQKDIKPKYQPGNNVVFTNNKVKTTTATSNTNSNDTQQKEKKQNEQQNGNIQKQKSEKPFNKNKKFQKKDKQNRENNDTSLQLKKKEIEKINKKQGNIFLQKSTLESQKSNFKNIIDQEKNQKPDEKSKVMSKGQKRKLKKKINKEKQENEAKSLKQFTPSIELFKKAESLYQEKAREVLQKYKLAKKDEQWLKKIMTEGTMKDKISAIQIYVRDNPTYTLTSLENLLSICESKNKKEASNAFIALKNLFITVLLKKEPLQTFVKNVQLKKGQHTDSDLKHNRLTWIVIKEIERFVYRKNIGIKAQFYAINFLNTLNVQKLDIHYMKELINFLFTLFTKILENGDEEMYQSKLLTQILRGLQSPDMTGTSLHELFFDILYFALKQDYSLNRVRAFLKRLLQVAMHNEAHFAITSLIFVSKILKIHPSLQAMFSHSEKFYLEEDDEEHFVDQDSSDGEEHFVDQDESDDENAKQKKVDQKKLQKKNNNNKDSQQKQGNNKDKQYKPTYDPQKREPLYANAQDCGMWEVNILCKHSHPTISKFANMLLKGQDIIYKSNPLVDFTLANFLDRFSLKKMKKKEGKGVQALKAKGKIRMSKFEQELTVDSVLNKVKNDQMREDEKYFIKYFEQKHKKMEREGVQKKEKKTQEELEDEMDEYADELFTQKMQDPDIDDDLSFDEDELEYSDVDIDEENQEIEDFDGENQEELQDGQEEYDEDEEIDEEEIKKLQQKMSKKDQKKEKKQQKPSSASAFVDYDEYMEKLKKYDDEFEQEGDFDDNFEEDLEDDEEDDEDINDFGALLDKAGHDEIEEIQKFKDTKKINKKKMEEDKREAKKATRHKNTKKLQPKSKKISKRKGRK